MIRILSFAVACVRRPHLTWAALRRQPWRAFVTRNPFRDSPVRR